MLDEMPELEIYKLRLVGANNAILHTLQKKLKFESKHDLYKVLEYDDLDVSEEPWMYEYIPKVIYPERHIMNWFVKRTECIEISTLEGDMNIDCMANKIKIYSECIEKMKTFSLGTTKFFNSVRSVIIIRKSSYNQFNSELDFKNDINLVHEYFNNAQSINLQSINSLSLK